MNIKLVSRLKTNKKCNRNNGGFIKMNNRNSLVNFRWTLKVLGMSALAFDQLS